MVKLVYCLNGKAVLHNKWWTAVIHDIFIHRSAVMLEQKSRFFKEIRLFNGNLSKLLYLFWSSLQNRTIKTLQFAEDIVWEPYLLVCHSTWAVKLDVWSDGWAAHLAHISCSFNNGCKTDLGICSFCTKRWFVIAAFPWLWFVDIHLVGCLRCSQLLEPAICS